MEDNNEQNLLNNDDNNNAEKEEKHIQNEDKINNEEENNNNEINIIEEKNNINENEIKNIKEENEIQNEEQIQNNKEKEGEKNENKKRSDNIPLFINSAKIIDVNSIKVFIYFLKGTSVPNKIARSFKDIQLYQDFLRISWPCTYIPNFPFREELIEENSKILPEEKKISLLNHFFRQIGENKHLLECEITKVFVTKPRDYMTEMSSFKKENYKDISEKYSKIFTDFVYNRKEIEEKETFINNFKTTLDDTFKQFIIIGATILKELLNVNREQNTIKFITNMFIDLEQAMPNKKKRLTKVNELVAPLTSVSNISNF